MSQYNFKVQQRFETFTQFHQGGQDAEINSINGEFQNLN